MRGRIEKSFKIQLKTPWKLQQKTQNSTENLAKKDSPEDPNPPDYTAEPIKEHPCHSCLQDVLPEPEPNTRCSF